MRNKLKFLFVTIFGITVISGANAAVGGTDSGLLCAQSPGGYGTGTVLLHTTCLTSTQVCYGVLDNGNSDTCVNSCNSCGTGTTRTQKTGGLANKFDSCTFSYYDCVSNSKTCSTTSSSTCSGTTEELTGCGTSSTYCFGGTKVVTCDTCNVGYTRTSKSISVDGCSNTYTQYYCKKKTIISTCNENLNCISDKDWKNVLGETYQKKATRRCMRLIDGGSTCTVISTLYRCAPGYYGTDQDCVECPDGASSISATTATSGSYTNTINDCYKTSGSDITGDYKYVNSDDSAYKCRYSGD